MIKDLAKNIDIYSDIKNLNDLTNFRKYEWIKGFTSNPSLVRAGGSTNYINFIKSAIPLSNNLPFSVEVISDDLDEMMDQALYLNSLGNNIFVKIPITNTKKVSTVPLVLDLMSKDIKVNVTAVMTVNQIEKIYNSIPLNKRIIISIFAGRIADTGVDPVPLMKEISKIKPKSNLIQLLWASPREILNILQAIECGVDIITATPEILKKFSLLGKNLEEYSLETVKMFYTDAQEAGFRILEIDN